MLLNAFLHPQGIVGRDLPTACWRARRPSTTLTATPYYLPDDYTFHGHWRREQDYVARLLLWLTSSIQRSSAR